MEDYNEENKPLMIDEALEDWVITKCDSGGITLKLTMHRSLMNTIAFGVASGRRKT